MNAEDSKVLPLQRDEKNGRVALAGAAAVGGATVLATSQPAHAQGAVAEINTMVTSLGTITAGVVTVIVGALTVRLAVKMINRLTVKG
jgi:hypothetical protein